jgi:GntR family transcriptional regulator
MPRDGVDIRFEEIMGTPASNPAIPLYEQVKRQISEAILQGVWAAGDVLPGEVALAKQYGVAVGTIRRALADLALEGLVSRRQRTGTVVTGRMPQHTLRSFYQYFRLHRSDGALVQSEPEILSLKRPRSRRSDTYGFDLPAGSELVQIHRLRKVDGRPIMHEIVTIPAARMPGFPDRLQDVPDLLYLYLLEQHGIRISAVRDSLTAEVASVRDRELLGLAERAAVLVCDSRAYDQSGEPCIFSHQRATTRQFTYVNEVR